MRANNLTLLTDLYELTMMQGYFKNPTNQTVVFDMFYRDNPCGGGFAICAGLVALVHFGVIGNIDYLNQLVSYLNVKNMAIIYALTILMSLLLAARYSKSLFKKTAMNAYKEEV